MARPRNPLKVKAVSRKQSMEIERLWMESYKIHVIADLVKLSEDSVRAHIFRVVQPRLKESWERHVDDERAKVDYLAATAWKCFHASLNPTTQEDLEYELTHVEGQKKPDEKLIKRAVKKVTTSGVPAWLQIVIWCREWNARVGGFYKPPSREDATGAEALPMVFVKVSTREEAKEWIDMEEFRRERDRGAIEVRHSEAGE